MSYAAQFGASLELPVHLRRSLTSDRGVEMARHGEFARAIGTPVFFCDPASPRFGQAARHIADAQRAGAPRLLRVNRTGVSQRRAAATGQLARVRGVDRDEYPPAFARSVGQAVSVRYIDPFSNRGLGASLGAATRRLDDGARFLVTVVP